MNHNHPSPTTSPRRRALAIGALAALTTLSACGSSDGKADGIASVDDVDSTTVPATAGLDGETVDDNEVVFADYEQCMADEGVELPTVEEEGGNSVGGESESAPDPADFDQDAFMAANEVCGDILEAIDSPMDDLDPEQQALLDDFLVEMEQCLSDKGFDVPLADLIGGFSGNDVDGDGPADFTLPPDFDFEAFDAAGSECEEQIGLPSELEDVFGEEG